VGAADAAEDAAQERMQRADTAADIQQARPVHSEMRGNELAQQVRLCGQEEIVRQSGEVDRRLDDRAVTVPVFVEERRHRRYETSCKTRRPSRPAASLSSSKPTFCATT